MRLVDLLNEGLKRTEQKLIEKGRDKVSKMIIYKYLIYEYQWNWSGPDMGGGGQVFKN